jgi:hypothetical protein
MMTSKPRKKSVYRTLFATLLLSSLVWLYADQINSETIEELVTLEIAPQSGSELLVELQEPVSGQLQVVFSGPRDQLEGLRRDLGTGKFKLIYYVTGDEAKDEFLVKDPRELVGSLIRKEYKSISVDEIKSVSQIKIYVDHLITATIPVKVETGANIKTKALVVTPLEVKVLLPKSVYQNLYETEKFIVLDLENELQGRPEELMIDENFALPQKLAGQPVVTDPTRVRVQLTIDRQLRNKTFEIPSTSVQVQGPIDLLAKYRVDIRDQQIMVTLQGPADIIKNIKPQDISAYIILTVDDMLPPRSSYFPRELKFVLPEGVKLDKEKLPRVDFKLVELQSAAPVENR